MPAIVPSLPGARTGEPPGSGEIFPGVVAHRGRGWTWMSGHGDRAAPGVAGRAAMGDPVRDGDDGLRASDITDRQTASGSTYWTALRSSDRRPWSLFSQPTGRYPERAFAAGVPAARACSRALPVSRGQAPPPRPRAPPR